MGALGTLFPSGIPSMSNSSSSEGKQGNTGGQTVGAFTVGGGSNQMMIFAGVGLLLVAVVFLGARK